MGQFHPRLGEKFRLITLNRGQNPHEPFMAGVIEALAERPASILRRACDEDRFGVVIFRIEFPVSGQMFEELFTSLEFTDGQPAGRTEPDSSGSIPSAVDDAIGARDPGPPVSALDEDSEFIVAAFLPRILIEVSGDRLTCDTKSRDIDHGAQEVDIVEEQIGFRQGQKIFFCVLLSVEDPARFRGRVGRILGLQGRES